MPGCSFPSISETSRAASRRPAFPFRKRAQRPPPALAAILASLGLAALALSGCAGSGSIPAPTAKHVEYAGRNGQVTTLASLNMGRKLYIGRCSACHGLKDPAALAPAEWPDMVARMAENAKINEDQKRLVTQYLVSISAAARDTAATASQPPAAAPKEAYP